MELLFSYFHSYILIIMKHILIFEKRRNKYLDKIRRRKYLKFELNIAKFTMLTYVWRSEWQLIYFFDVKKMSTLVLDLVSKRTKRLITICRHDRLTDIYVHEFAMSSTSIFKYNIMKATDYSNRLHWIGFKHFEKTYFFLNFVVNLRFSFVFCSCSWVRIWSKCNAWTHESRYQTKWCVNETIK